MTDQVAKFQVIGTLDEAPILKESAKGNKYTRPAIKVKPTGKGFTRRYFQVAFGETAEDFCAECGEGDLVETRGDLQWQKNNNTGRYEISFLIREYRKLEAAADLAEEIAAAFDAEDSSDIPF